MNPRHCLLAAAGALLMLAPPARAQEEPRVVDLTPFIKAVDMVELPFKPPIGEPLHYRLTRTFEGAGAPPEIVIDQHLTFAPSPSGGVELTVTTTGVTQGGKLYTADGALHELRFVQDMVALFAPMKLELGPGGRPLRVLNFEDLRQNLALLQGLIRKGARDERERELAERVIAAFPAPPPDATAEMAARGAVPLWSEILGYGGVTAPNGETREWSNTRPFLGGQATLTQRNKATFERTASGGYRVRTERVDDPENFAEAIDAAESSGDEARMAEARRLRLNQDFLYDFPKTTAVELELDERGMIVSGSQVVTQGPGDGRVYVTRSRIERVESPAPAAS